MASITIRRLNDALMAKLRKRAASHGRSMEEEARQILLSALQSELLKLNVAQRICRHVEPFGGVELALPFREPFRRPPKLGIR